MKAESWTDLKATNAIGTEPAVCVIFRVWSFGRTAAIIRDRKAMSRDVQPRAALEFGQSSTYLDARFELSFPSAWMLQDNSTRPTIRRHTPQDARIRSQSSTRHVQLHAVPVCSPLTGSREPCHGDKKLISCSKGSRYTHL